MKLKRKNKKSRALILIMVFTLINLSNISKMLKSDLENLVEKNVNKSIYNYIFYMFDKDTLESGNLLDIISLNENSDGELVSVDYKYNIAYKYLNDSLISDKFSDSDDSLTLLAKRLSTSDIYKDKYIEFAFHQKVDISNRVIQHHETKNVL